MNHALFTLARQGILRRRRSSLLLFLVLLLSFAFAVMMLSVMGSMDRTNTELLKNTYGGWYGAIPDGKAEDRAFLEQREWLDQLGRASTTQGFPSFCLSAEPVRWTSRLWSWGASG